MQREIMEDRKKAVIASIKQSYLPNTEEFAKEHVPIAIDTIQECKREMESAKIRGDIDTFNKWLKQFSASWARLFTRFVEYKLEEQDNDVSQLTFRELVHLDKHLMMKSGFGDVHIYSKQEKVTKSKEAIKFSALEVADLIKVGGLKMFAKVALVRSVFPGSKIRSVKALNKKMNEIKDPIIKAFAKELEDAS